MRVLFILLSLLAGTIGLIVSLDYIQGHPLFESWQSIKSVLSSAQGEDYFLMVIFILGLFVMYLLQEKKKK
ncbi:hypothetical protein NVV31_14305 [Cytobacillus firmus]|uniref:hypothetical protein n=1 Tax=Cytobacillus TaxID=2675230 RepID=UPI00064EC1D1|nr:MULTISPECIES: hypothetical protein [Cytobacillus]KML39393.1 hypothetical protein VL14_15995 [Cytobacillus firmus]MCC3647035.1 hypothetical protein [Cytobacillus oceanisediminis]MCS0653583.1 hypothetical protein [Cytobacillus firmus]MCU1806555.1 hypothetical protein [Cytobacillus firmus]